MVAPANIAGVVRFEGDIYYGVDYGVDRTFHF